jgi:hypothetical protein
MKIANNSGGTQAASSCVYLVLTGRLSDTGLPFARRKVSALLGERAEDTA